MVMGKDDYGKKISMMKVVGGVNRMIMGRRLRRLSFGKWKERGCSMYVDRKWGCVQEKEKKKWSEKEECSRVIKGKKDHFPGWWVVFPCWQGTREEGKEKKRKKDTRLTKKKKEWGCDFQREEEWSVGVLKGEAVIFRERRRTGCCFKRESDCVQEWFGAVVFKEDQSVF